MRTSSEAAATVRASTDAVVLASPHELEAYGELPSPYHLPLSKPVSPYRRMRKPLLRLDAHALALASKWGIGEADATLGGVETSGGRVTRTRTSAMRSSMLPEAAEVSHAAQIDHTGSGQLPDVSRMGARDDPDVRTGGAALADAGDSAAHGGVTPEELERGDPQLSSSAAQRSLGGSFARGDTESPFAMTRKDVEHKSEGWTVVAGVKQGHSIPCAQFAIAQKFFPTWFDLCEADDQLGPLPSLWHPAKLFSGAGSFSPDDADTIPELRRIVLDSDSDSDEEREVQRSLELSIVPTHVHSIDSMGVIVEIPEEPEGADGRFSSEQKAKSVSRNSVQREFLNRYTRGTPETLNIPLYGQNGSVGPIPSSRFAARTQATFGLPKREQSMRPDGGFFGTGSGGHGGPPQPPSPPPSMPPSTDGYSSSSSSDSDGSASFAESHVSDDQYAYRTQAQRERKHRKKKAQKARSRILDALKVPQPSKWDGTVNLDKFDTWVYEVRTWQKLAEISDDIALCLMPRFLSGKPQTFFMRHVADSESKWSMHALFEALFDYCFPKDYKATLCAQLESA